MPGRLTVWLLVAPALLAACVPPTTTKRRRDAGGAEPTLDAAPERSASPDLPEETSRPLDAPPRDMPGVVADAAVDRPPDRPVDAARDVRPVDAGPAPTFTELWTMYFNQNASATVIGCRGPACHNVNHEGFICSTKANCYDSISIRVDVPEEPEENIIYIILKEGTMPKGTMKKLGAAELAKLRAWIVAGAKNN